MTRSSTFGKQSPMGTAAGQGVRRRGDVIRYTSCGYHCLRQCILKVRIRDGVIIACEPDIDKRTEGKPRADLEI